jgi:hypothetical protein
MTAQRNDKIYFTVLDGTRYLAATNTSPYFCFEAHSEAELYKKLKNARIFCEKFIDDHREREHLVQPFEIIKTIQSKELEDA